MLNHIPFQYTVLEFEPPEPAWQRLSQSPRKGSCLCCLTHTSLPTSEVQKYLEVIFLPGSAKSWVIFLYLFNHHSKSSWFNHKLSWITINAAWMLHWSDHQLDKLTSHTGSRNPGMPRASFPATCRRELMKGKKMISKHSKSPKIFKNLIHKMSPSLIYKSGINHKDIITIHIVRIYVLHLSHRRPVAL